MEANFRAPTLLSPALQIALVLTSALGVVVGASELMMGTTDAEIDAFAAQSTITALVTLLFALAALGYGVCFIACIVMFPMFMYRAVKNIHALGDTLPNTTPGLAAGAWFIPFANLMIPYRSLVELDRASRPSEDGPTSSVIGIYWVCWVAANLLSGAAERNPDLGILAAVLIAIAGGLAASIVRTIDRNQRERASQRGVNDLAPVFA